MRKGFSKHAIYWNSTLWIAECLRMRLFNPPQVMDRHLDLIVGQTERYSKLLAQNLAQGLAQDGVSIVINKCFATARRLLTAD